MKTWKRALMVVMGLVSLVGPVIPAAGQRPLRVVTSTTDLADLASEVCGNRCQVVHISEGYQDPHFVEAKPSFILQLRNADVFAFVGLDLEVGWMPLLLQGARNPKINPGGTGYLDVSRAIRVLDRPAGNVDRSGGDVHPAGNPHYWLDPENGKRIARAIAAKLSEMDSANAALFKQRLADFERRVDAADARWKAALAPYKAVKIVT